MTSSALEFCRRAVAYLKVELPDDGLPALVLNDADSPVFRRIGNGLLVAYLVDEGDHFAYVQGRHMQEAALTVDELHDIGLSNLAAFSHENAKVHKHGNIYVVIAGGQFEASMLLCDEFWAVWYAELAPNGFVASFPARDILAFGDCRAAETIPELLAMCARAGEHPDHALTRQLFCRSGAKWAPLLVH